MSINKIINFIAFQIIWLIAVIGAANELIWPTIIIVGLFCVWQLSPKRRHKNDLRLVIFALITGLILDSTWQASGLIQYQLSLPFIAPIWILSLWVCLALGINHSLAWLKKSLWLPILFGAIGAPLSYLAGNRLGALSYPDGLLMINILLSISWAAVMCGFTQFDRLFTKLSSNKNEY